MLKKIFSVIVIFGLLAGFSTAGFAADEKDFGAALYDCSYRFFYPTDEPGISIGSTIHTLEIRFSCDVVSIKENAALLYNFFYGLSAKDFVFDAASDTIFIHSKNNSDIERINIPANTVFDADGNGNAETELIKGQKEIRFDSLNIPASFDKADNRYYFTAGENLTVKTNDGTRFEILVDNNTLESNVAECPVPVEEGVHNVCILIPNVGKFELDYEGRAYEGGSLSYAECVQKNSARALIPCFNPSLPLYCRLRFLQFRLSVR